VVRSCRQRIGGACPLCLGDSKINLFDNSQRVVNLDAEIADCALDLGVAEQELHGSMAQSGSDELLAWRVVADLVAGAGLKFAERVSFESKGLPGRWDPFAASG